MTAPLYIPLKSLFINIQQYTISDTDSVNEYITPHIQYTNTMLSTSGYKSKQQLTIDLKKDDFADPCPNFIFCFTEIIAFTVFTDMQKF